MALAAKYHLKGKKKFDEVLASGKVIQSDSFGIAFKSRGIDSNSCFGFIVSTKVSKHAVLRNRVRRALSEAVRFLMGEVRDGFDVVFLAKSLSLKKSTSDLMNEVRPAMKKAKLLK